MAAMPELRPSAGFCIQTTSTSSSPGRWYVNICKHKMCEMPIAYSGKPVSRDWILANGIGNMQVPFDIGSFRKVKERAEGAKQTTYCIDVIFNPLIVQLFMEDDFCNKMAQFRPFVINLALKRIEDSIGVRLASDKVKLVKSLRYKDGEGADGSYPREFADLPGNADCFDDEVPRVPQQQQPDLQEAEPLIQDMTPGAKKPALKKGFLNSSKNAGALYPDGSGEGVQPENAGDPMGWMPKKLRNTCKIVDTNAPEYQQQQKQRDSVDETNKMNKEFKDQLNKDMEKWIKNSTPDKWHEDLPEGTEPPGTTQKYDVDYSRFDKLDDIEDGPKVEERDWYYDSVGQQRRLPSKSSASPAAADEDSAAAAAAEPALKKGFLGDAKKPLYPKGSEQARAPPSEEDFMKGLLQEEASAAAAEARREAEREKKPSVAVKVNEAKAPDFELKEAAEGLQLVVGVPGLDSMQDVSLDVTERRASLGFPPASGLKPLQVELPVAVVPTKVKAKFSKKSKQITVTLPGAA